MEQIDLLNSKIIKKRSEDSSPLIQSWELTNSLFEEIVKTNELEGISSTRKIIKEVYQEKSEKPYKRFYGMVNKYKEIYFSSNDFKPITSPEQLRAAYDGILLKDIEVEDKNNVPDGETFRKDGVEVERNGYETIHKGLYPESKIIQAVNDSLGILNNSQIPNLIREAIFHYLFGYIHPFYDGNGRFSRYISSYYLSDTLDNIASLRLAIACKKRQKDYYEAFQETNDIRNCSDLTNFVLVLLDIFKSELNSYYSELSDKVAQSKYYHNKQSELNLDKNCKTILYKITEYSLFHLEPIDIDDLVEFTRLSKSTITNRVKELEESHYIIRQKDGKKATFVFNPDSM